MCEADWTENPLPAKIGYILKTHSEICKFTVTTMFLTFTSNEKGGYIHEPKVYSAEQVLASTRQNLWYRDREFCSQASILPVEQTSGTCNKHQYKNFVFCKIHVSVIYINIQNKILKQFDPGDDFDK